MKYFIFLIGIASLVSCVSPTEYSSGKAEAVPPSRLYGFTKKSDAQLIVVSESRTLEKCTTRLSIDGKHAADFLPGEEANFGVTIGMHKLIALPLDDCENSTVQEAKVNVKAGDALIKRIERTGLNPVSY